MFGEITGGKLVERRSVLQLSPTTHPLILNKVKRTIVFLNQCLFSKESKFVSW